MLACLLPALNKDKHTHLIWTQHWRGSSVLCLSKIIGQFLHLEVLFPVFPHLHHPLLPCKHLCTHYDQNTVPTMSQPKWEEMSTVSAPLQHDDAVISEAQGVLMFGSSGGDESKWPLNRSGRQVGKSKQPIADYSVPGGLYRAYCYCRGTATQMGTAYVHVQKKN